MYSFIVYGTYADTQMQLVASVKGSTSKMIEPKRKKKRPRWFYSVTDGHVDSSPRYLCHKMFFG